MAGNRIFLYLIKNLFTALFWTCSYIYIWAKVKEMYIYKILVHNVKHQGSKDVKGNEEKPSYYLK